MVHLAIPLPSYIERKKSKKFNKSKKMEESLTLAGLVPLSSALEECELDGKAVKVMLVQVAIVVKVVPSHYFCLSYLYNIDFVLHIANKELYPVVPRSGHLKKEYH